MGTTNRRVGEVHGHEPKAVRAGFARRMILAALVVASTAPATARAAMYIIETDRSHVALAGGWNVANLLPLTQERYFGSYFETARWAGRSAPIMGVLEAVVDARGRTINFNGGSVMPSNGSAATEFNALNQHQLTTQTVAGVDLASQFNGIAYAYGMLWNGLAFDDLGEQSLDNARITFYPTAGSLRFAYSISGGGTRPYSDEFEVPAGLRRTLDLKVNALGQIEIRGYIASVSAVPPQGWPQNAFGGDLFLSLVASPVEMPTWFEGAVKYFQSVQSGRWFDPPVVPAYEYAMTDGSKFTEILGFPGGFRSPFTVTANGVHLGTFEPGDKLVLPGGGVSRFTISGIDPESDASLFALKLGFSTPTASFSVTPISAVPEPASLAMLGVGAVALVVAGASTRRRP